MARNGRFNACRRICFGNKIVKIKCSEMSTLGKAIFIAGNSDQENLAKNFEELIIFIKENKLELIALNNENTGYEK